LEQPLINIPSVINRQVNQFRHADSQAKVFLVRRRYLPGLLWRLAFPFSMVLALLLRLALLALKPLVHVRFGRMYSQSIGTWDIPMELYLCQKDAGIHPKNSWDVFYHFDPDRHTLVNPPKITEMVPNRQVEKMIGSNLIIVQPVSVLDSLNRMISSGSSQFSVPLSNPFDADNLLQDTPPHFSFTLEEEELGRAELKRIGVEEGAPFVCFHVRDGEFLYQVRPRVVSVYGDWQDQPYRNATMENFLPAADRLTEQGYFVLRMGQWSKNAMQHSNSKVIDYASEFQTDFMDAYLSAKCKFFIGTNSGMTSIPMMYRTPLALVNVVPYSEISYSGTNDLFILKKYYSKTQERLLTLNEILSEPLLLHYNNKYTDSSRAYYDSIGLDIQENSPEEITGLVKEIEQRERGEFQPSQEDKELQARYLTIIRAHSDNLAPVRGVENRRIGSHFLRTNSGILD